MRDILAAGAEMDLPEFQFVLGELRGVDELLDIDDSAAAWAGTLGQTALEHRKLALDQFAPFGGGQAQKVLDPEK